VQVLPKRAQRAHLNRSREHFSYTAEQEAGLKRHKPRDTGCKREIRGESKKEEEKNQMTG
jgi:hypothetical protein